MNPAIDSVKVEMTTRRHKDKIYGIVRLKCGTAA